jgi:hypothetical protein
MMTDPNVDRRARVFISCGQNKDSNEVAIAQQIVARLEKLGFDPYIAVQEQTLRGLKENIFGQLARSEYFIFVDFKREKLGGDDVYRGSLFAHQELALASFLDIEVLALQEAGVKQHDGILGFLQANTIPFTDRHRLPSVIADKVKERNWNPNWRNELVLERDPNQFLDVQLRPLDKMARYFYIGVKNRHRDNVARNCYVYLEKAIRLDPRSEIKIPATAMAFTWAGYGLPNAHIPPGATRPFDAFYILHEQPTQLQFSILTTYTGSFPQVNGEGSYELQYVVLADNFAPVRCRVSLNLANLLKSTTLK